MGHFLGLTHPFDSLTDPSYWQFSWSVMNYLGNSAGASEFTAADCAALDYLFHGKGLVRTGILANPNLLQFTTDIGLYFKSADNQLSPIQNYFMQGYAPELSAWVAWFSTGAPDLFPMATIPASVVADLQCKMIAELF